MLSYDHGIQNMISYDFEIMCKKPWTFPMFPLNSLPFSNVHNFEPPRMPSIDLYVVIYRGGTPKGGVHKQDTSYYTHEFNNSPLKGRA